MRSGHFKHESSPFRLLKKTRQLDAPRRICLIYWFFLVYLSSLLFPLPSFFLLFLALHFCWIVLRFFGLGLSEAVFLSSPSRSPTWDNFLTCLPSDYICEPLQQAEIAVVVRVSFWNGGFALSHWTSQGFALSHWTVSPIFIF